MYEKCENLYKKSKKSYCTFTFKSLKIYNHAILIH